MGNCDLKLNNLNRAEQEYFQCIAHEPAGDIAQRCNSALKFIRANKERIEKKQNAASMETKKIAGTASGGNAPAADREQLADKLSNQAEDQFAKRRAAAVELKRKIMDDAVKEAKLVRDRAKDSLESYKMTVRNTGTGEYSYDVPTILKNQILDSAEAEAERIMKCAEIRSRGVEVPEADSTASGIKSQLMDQRKGAVRLDHHGTNLYVRNYVQTAPRNISSRSNAPASANASQAKSPARNPATGSSGGPLIGTK